MCEVGGNHRTTLALGQGVGITRFRGRRPELRDAGTHHYGQCAAQNDFAGTAKRNFQGARSRVFHDRRSNHKSRSNRCNPPANRQLDAIGNKSGRLLSATKLSIWRRRIYSTETTSVEKRRCLRLLFLCRLIGLPRCQVANGEPKQPPRETELQGVVGLDF